MCLGRFKFDTLTFPDGFLEMGVSYFNYGGMV